MKLILTLFYTTFFCASAFGQIAKNDLSSSFRRFSIVKINSRDALRKAESGTPLEIQIGAQIFRFMLHASDVRAADYTAEYTDNAGRHKLPRDQSHTFQGIIVGEPDSLVALTIDGTTTEGFFATQGENFFIEPAQKYSAQAADDDKVVYRSGDKIGGSDYLYGADEIPANGFKGANLDGNFNLPFSPQTDLRILEVATEADQRFVEDSLLGNGDPAKANAHILAVMNQVDAVYRRDLNLRVVVTFQHAWTPGTSNPYANLHGSDLLYSFLNYWNANFSPSNPAYRRDVAHLFTLEGGNTGLAIPESICQGTAGAYSFTSINNSSKWVTTAHEIGHNLGADHDVYGTIMSAVFNAFATNFSQFSINQINAYVSAYGARCLEPDAAANEKTPFDYDGDGKSDISVFRSSNGFWYLSKSSGGFSSVQWGKDRDVPVPGDFDGDGKTDLAVFRHGTGTATVLGDPVIPDFWYVLRSSDNTFYSRDLGLQSGLINNPVPADYDGDGKTDLAVYSSEDGIPSLGYYVVLQSSTDTKIMRQWGINSDQIVPADYDGDGKADLAVVRNGIWYILQSSNGAVRVEYFGLSTDQFVPADYDGDGKADLVVWRPSNGVWYRINSTDNSFVAFQFGLSDDKPAPADYDGDGKTDIAVFRPSSGVWYLQQSSKGFRAEQFGLSGDIPVPNVFVR